MSEDLMPSQQSGSETDTPYPIGDLRIHEDLRLYVNYSPRMYWRQFPVYMGLTPRLERGPTCRKAELTP